MIYNWTLIERALVLDGTTDEDLAVEDDGGPEVGDGGGCEDPIVCDGRGCDAGGCDGGIVCDAGGCDGGIVCGGGGCEDPIVCDGQGWDAGGCDDGIVCDGRNVCCGRNVDDCACITVPDQPITKKTHEKMNKSTPFIFFRYQRIVIYAT